MGFWTMAGAGLGLAVGGDSSGLPCVEWAEHRHGEIPSPQHRAAGSLGDSWPGLSQRPDRGRDSDGAQSAPSSTSPPAALASASQRG